MINNNSWGNERESLIMDDAPRLSEYWELSLLKTGPHGTDNCVTEYRINPLKLSTSMV